MKTVVEELIEKLQEIHRQYPVNNALNRSVKGAYVDCVILAKELLTKEKQQIADAYNQGYRDGENAEESTKALIDVSQWADAENYYNKTFKTTDNGKEI